MNATTVTRRRFLSQSATVGTGLAFAGLKSPLVAQDHPAPKPLEVGIIGVGGRGNGLISEFQKFQTQYNARITAVCDIWKQRREQAAARLANDNHEAPRAYGHINQMLEDPRIEAVIIATADHQHAGMLQLAVEAGKDVYCEKPMANVLTEANAALQAVRKSQRVVQIGTQRRSYPKYRRAMQLMREGVIGDVVKADVIWNAYSPYRWAPNPEALAALTEKDVKWPEFLMGKPARPFDSRVYLSFRLFRDFSSGIIDQWMTHGVDVIHFLTGESFPLSVVAHGGLYQFHDYRENPDTVQVLLEYGQGDQKFLANYATTLVNGSGSITRVQGTRGTMVVEKDWRVSGEGSGRSDRVPEGVTIEDAPDTLPLMANWLDCVRRRDPSGLYSPVEAGYGHSIACIMSTEALWQGRRMVFDAEKQQILPG